MRPEDYYLHYAITTAELAFELSPLNRYGQDAQAKFISQWIKEKAKDKSDKALSNYIKKMLKAYRTPERLVAFWKSAKDSITLSAKIFARCKGLNDLARLQDLAKSVEPEGLLLIMENEGGQTAESSYLFRISMSQETASKLSRENIPYESGITLTYTIDESCSDRVTEIVYSKAIACFQEHGFTVLEISRRNKAGEIVIGSAADCPWVQKLTPK